MGQKQYLGGLSLTLVSHPRCVLCTVLYLHRSVSFLSILIPIPFSLACLFLFLLCSPFFCSNSFSGTFPSVVRWLRRLHWDRMSSSFSR